MRLSRLAALLLGLLALCAAQPAFAAPVTELGPARPVRARAAASHGPSVSRALATLLGSGAISAATYKQDLAVYLAAKRSLGRLSGTRREELGAVLSNVQSIAAAGLLSGSRQAAVFLTLQENRHWWTEEPLISSGERLTFPPSKLIWEYYPGQGIEIQWLATFGKGNGYFLSGHENSNLRQLVSEVIPLASQRSGGIAWEYLFRFDGGVPPWTSGLSQGTALQVLSRAWSRFKEPSYLAAAQRALGIYRARTPSGVRVPTPAGAEYAEYTYAPTDRILNGFIQALVGLYDYTSITKDPLGLKLFEEGDAEARVEVPHYDTGAWSLYDQYGESDLNYHELLTEFLQHLCERTRKGPPLAPAAPPPPSTPSAPPTTTPPTTGTGTGGTGGGSSPSARGATASQIAGDQVYCATAQRFAADLHTPPAIALLTTRLKGATRAGLQVSLSKISTVTWTIHQNGRTVYTNRATVAGGKPRLLWPTPAAGGIFTVTLTAGDLAGNFSTATGTILVSRH
ncbi:MAG: D-glucuronyl C5-epimerase family protein [Solirubrobacteraceae bacterium]